MGCGNKATVTNNNGVATVYAHLAAFAGGAGDWVWAPFGSLGLASPASPGAYRKYAAVFHIRWDWTFGWPDFSVGYGQADDRGLMCDWNGNGTRTFGVFRPSNRTFYLRANTSTGAQPTFASFDFGEPGASPFVADWDGNGTDTIGVAQPGAEPPGPEPPGQHPRPLYWYVRNSNTPGWPDFSLVFGAVGDVPVPAAYPALRPTLGREDRYLEQLRIVDEGGRSLDFTVTTGVAPPPQITGWPAGRQVRTIVLWVGTDPWPGFCT